MKFSLNSISSIRDLSLRSADQEDGITVGKNRASAKAYEELESWGYVEKLWEIGMDVAYKTTEIGRNILLYSHNVHWSEQTH